MPGLSLAEAIESLYNIAVVQGKSQSTIRLQRLGEFCVEKLASFGLSGAQREVTIPGGGREKQWDVAWQYHAKHRLAISLKSILRNLPGTVPNRVDDLMGEVANIQMYSPEIVVGYVMILDVSTDTRRARGTTWSDLLNERLTRLSGRRAPSWSIGMIESFALVQVDFSKGPRLLTPEASVIKMLKDLANEVKARNPSLPAPG